MTENKQSKPIPLSVFIGNYLPYSETFIYDQLQNQKEFQAKILSYGRVPSAERFPYEDIVSLNSFSRKLYLSLGLSSEFSKHIKEQNPALLHAHFGTNGVYATPFAKKQKVPLAVTFHGHDVPGLFKKNKYTSRYARYQFLAHKMFDYSSLYLPASQELADILIRDFGVDENKVRIHRLGIDLNKFSFAERPDRPPQILMIGRFVEKKGFHIALQAFAKIVHLFPDTKLTLVGSGPFKSLYEKIILEKKLSNNVFFSPPLTSAELHQQMLDHDILVAPSMVAQNGDRESGLIVLKEAAATGLPSIGTYHGGLPEIIAHENTGLLVEENNIDSLAHSMTELLSSFKLRSDMGISARKKMSFEYDTVKQNQLLESHFKSLL